MLKTKDYNVERLTLQDRIELYGKIAYNKRVLIDQMYNGGSNQKDIDTILYGYYKLNRDKK